MSGENPKSPVRILHLEDSERDAELVEAALTEAGVAHETVRVFSGADFARCVGKGGFDLILSDYTMPGFSGGEALALARERCPEVPFIYVSGTVGEERAVEALQNGATDYVLKDRPAKLGPAVRRALDEAQSKRTCTLAQETLRRSEERFRRLVDGAADIIFTLTPEGNIDSLNPAFEKITGWPRADWLGRQVKDLIHPADFAGLIEAFARALEGGGTPPLEARFATRAGTYRNVESNITALVEGGRVTRAFGIARDITEFKTTQRMLEQAQKMEAVGQLAGGVAHEFNNILSVITATAEFLISDLPKGSQQRADAEEILKTAHRAAALTKQLLAFSRKQIVEPREVAVNDVLKNSAKMLGRLIGEHVTLEMKLAPDTATIFADPGQIDQVIMNLAVNARDAMPKGGKLVVETKDMALDEDAARVRPGLKPGGHVQITVSDSGTGMPPEIRDRVFEPFFTTKGEGKGTGLGLSVVYGAVKQNGGHIEVQSEVGMGTTFKLYFPHAASGAPAGAAHDAVEVPRGRGETILVVEDDEAVRRSIVRTLFSAGYKVVEAPSGDAALASCESLKNAVDLLLTDVVMPGVSGVTLAAAAQERCPGLKVLFCSGYTDEMLGLDFLGAERPELIRKPVDKDRMLKKVREALDK